MSSDPSNSADRFVVGKVDVYFEITDEDTLPTRDPNLPLPPAIIPRMVVPEQDVPGSTDKDSTE